MWHRPGRIPAASSRSRKSRKRLHCSSICSLLWSEKWEVDLLRQKADAVQAGVRLQRNRDFSSGLPCRLPQNRKLTEAAEGDQEIMFHRRFHLSVQRQAHHQDLLLQSRLTEFDPFRNMRHRKAVDPAEIGEKAPQRHRSESVGIGLQDRDQFDRRSQLPPNLFNILLQRLQIDLQIGVCRHQIGGFPF